MALAVNQDYMLSHGRELAPSNGSVIHEADLGASMYDVRTEGGSPKEDVVREVA